MNIQLTDPAFDQLPIQEQLAIMHHEAWLMRQEITLLAEAQLKRQMQLPEEVRVQPFRRKFNRTGYGKKARPLLESEILQARKETPSEQAAARWLGCSYNTFKKWAGYYGIRIKGGRSNGKGIPKSRRPTAPL